MTMTTARVVAASIARSHGITLEVGVDPHAIPTNPELGYVLNWMSADGGPHRLSPSGDARYLVSWLLAFDTGYGMARRQGGHAT